MTIEDLQYWESPHSIDGGFPTAVAMGVTNKLVTLEHGLTKVLIHVNMD